MDVKYTHVIARFFPQAQHYSTGPRYEDIVWISDPIAKELLDEKMLAAAKDMRAESVRQDSIFIRAMATRLVVGTDDLLMLRTYDEKRREAEQFLLDADVSKCNLLQQEADSTGVSLSALAEAVLSQFQLSANGLNPMLGEIEAIRRNNTAAIYACSDMYALDDLLEPVWPDMSVLQAI